MRKHSDSETTGPAIERHRAVFTHPRRLSAVRCLASADDELHLADLARDVARSEESSGRESVDEDAAERIYVDLYHVHLPKLAEAGVVSFDPESRVASAAVDASSLDDWVAADAGRNRPNVLLDSAD